MSRIMVVDDEPEVLAAVREFLVGEGFEVSTSAGAEEALELVGVCHPDLAILDMWMPGMDGLEACRRLRRLNPNLPVIMMTGRGTTELAIDASEAGVFGYQPKPFEPERMLALIRGALEMTTPGERLVEPMGSADTLPDKSLVGESPAMQAVYHTIGRVARTDSTVLIRGESGTGKELVARAIWRHSARADRPLITLSCVAIPETLLEAELFGHERGAFTGAVAKRMGKFEQAEHGTILLDEIADISPSVQAKILRVLQERSFERVGGNKTLHVDVRIIAATNRNIEAAMRRGRFREDLYHRLHVVTIWVPSLRERTEDIIPLIRHFFTRFAREFQTEAPAISPDAVRILRNYAWPGNVRELEHCIQRLFLLNPGTHIRVDDVLKALEQRAGLRTGGRIDEDKVLLRAVRQHLSAHWGEGARDLLLEKVDRFAVMEALRRGKGNQTRASEDLGIPRPTLHAKMRKYGIRVGYHVESGTCQISDEQSAT